MEVSTDGIMAAVITTIGGYVLRGHNARLRKIEDNQAETNKNVSANALEAERRFAKEDTMQSRFDKLDERMERGFDEIRLNIKQLIESK